MSLNKSTPPKNRQLIVSYHQLKLIDELCEIRFGDRGAGCLVGSQAQLHRAHLCRERPHLPPHQRAHLRETTHTSERVRLRHPQPCQAPQLVPWKSKDLP